MKAVLIFVLNLLVGLFVVGCGGTDGGSGTSAPARGRVTLTVAWPDSRAIPAATRSIKVVAQVMEPEGGPVVGQVIAQRPAGQSTSQIVLENLPSVRVRLTANAHASTDGSGSVLASGTTLVEVREEDSVEASISMEAVGEVASIAVDTEAISIGVGARATLKARALDSQGNEVAVDPEDWEFLRSSSDLIVNEQPGGAGDVAEIWGYRPGTFEINVTHRPTSISTVVPVTVASSGTCSEFFIKLLGQTWGPSLPPIGDAGIPDPENPMAGLASGFCDTRALQVWMTSAGSGQGYVKHKILVHAPEIQGTFTAKLRFFPEVNESGGGTASITLKWAGGTDTLNQDLGGDIVRTHDIIVKHGDIIAVELVASASAPEDGEGKAAGFLELDPPNDQEADFYYLICD